MILLSRLALSTCLLLLLGAAPANATLLVKSDSTGLLVQDKNGIADRVVVSSTTQGGNPVYVVTNNNSFDVFKFDFKANCSEGANNTKAVCKKFSGKLNLAMVGGDDNVNVFGSGASSVSVNLGSDDDTYQGIDGADNVFGASGNDVMNTQGGADDITIGTGFDKVDAGSGNDSIDYNTTNLGDLGADEVKGGTGNDQIFLAFSSQDVRSVNAGAGDDTVRTGSGDDTIHGGAGRDDISSEDGDDKVTGGTEVDTVRTGRGNDEVDVKEADTEIRAADTVTCGQDTDFVTADLTDQVSAISDRGGGTCEQVERSPVGETPHVNISSKTLRVSRDGEVKVRLSCPKGVKKLGCKGSLQLRIARTRKGGVQASRSRKVRYKIKARKRKTVTLQLADGDIGTLRRQQRRKVKTRGILVSVEKGRKGLKTTVRNPRLKLRGG